MCEEMELDDLIALQEEEERRMMEEEEEADLEVIRELEAKENKFRRSLFQEEPDRDVETSKRARDDLNTSAPLTELPDDMENLVSSFPRSPAQKRARREREDDERRSVVAAAAEKVEQLVRRSVHRRVFRRIPEGDFQSVTLNGGERFYLRKKVASQEDVALDKGGRGGGDEGGLCGVSYQALLEQALLEQERKDEDVATVVRSMEEASSSGMDSGLGSASEDDSSQECLWVEKYRPRSFMELLSDAGTNRILLQWLKLWDKAVFNREWKKPRTKKELEKTDDNKKGKFGTKSGSATAASSSFLPEVVDELDENGLPAQKVALLHGPPGLGKTTLAHVIAAHAGYSVVEINASDDRSLGAFSSRVEAATQMRSVVSGPGGGDGRPNCLVVDEIDGAPAPAVNYLVSTVTGGNRGRKSGKKRHGLLQRPVICICNDLFVPSLRPLKQHCLTVPFPPTLPDRLSRRLLNIARREGLHTDLSALTTLCEKTDNDIRSCLSTLQFFKGRGKSLRLSDVHKTSVGQKDAQKGHFAVWRELFETPRASIKKFVQLPGRGGLVQESAAAIPVRYQSMLSTIQACGDYEKLMNGLFEMYLEVKFKDGQLANVTKGHEWFVFFDEVGAQIGRLQNYSLYAYLPFVFVCSHLLFSAAGRTKLTYPHVFQEQRQALLRNKNLLASVLAEMTPGARGATSATSLVFDVLPQLMDIIQPNLRPVNTQLYSAREKEELCDLVQVMTTYNLTYVQERTFEGQYVYRLDPAVDNITVFPTSSTDHHYQQQQSTRKRGLPYAIKQLIAREIDVERMRKEEAAEAKPLTAAAPLKEPKVKAGTPEALPNHLRQKLEAKKVDVTERRPVDFFGRPIDTETLKKSANKEEEERNRIVSSDIWFRFKEGYNNAVRRNVRMKDLS